MESNAVLDIVMPLLQEEGIIPFTIHDSFICVASEAERIREVFVTKLTEMFGVAPTLHMDYVVPEKEQEDMNEPEVWF